MRRLLIQKLLPLAFCVVPILAAALVAVALPGKARVFYLDNMSPLDWLIIYLGLSLFVIQLFLMYRGLSMRGGSFDGRTDRWISNMAQAAEWFPLLGLLGTVAGILQTFGSITGPTPPERIVALYAPAITATGSGLFMALINILPTWIVLVGRDLILALAGGPAAKK